MRVTLIHNPRAGVRQPSPSELLTLIRGAGHEVTYQSSEDDDWQDALGAHADLIAVAGGDGTVTTVARRLVGRGVPLTILPLGTANNVAKTLGLAGSPLQLVAGWDTARRVKLDIGVARGPWGDATFVEAFGLGLLPGLMSRLEARNNVFVGPPGDADDKVAQILRLLRVDVQNAPAREVMVELDGRVLSGKYFLVEAMNTRLIGPNLQLAPDANPSDGELDVILLADDDRERLARYVEGELNGNPGPRPASIRGRRLHLQSEGFLVHIDDDTWPDRDTLPFSPATVDVHVDSHAVELLVP